MLLVRREGVRAGRRHGEAGSTEASRAGEGRYVSPSQPSGVSRQSDAGADREAQQPTREAHAWVGKLRESRESSKLGSLKTNTYM